jgi:hypothetical protein
MTPITECLKAKSFS